MNVTTFRLENPKHVPVGNPALNEQIAVYRIPTLSAYAIIDSHLSLDSNPYIEIAHPSVDYTLKDDIVEIPNKHGNLFGSPTGLLIVYHNGIKDFQLLFPHIINESLRARLGEFAEEANNCFQSKSWVSYCLMVGGVLEGLLYHQFGDLKFYELTKKAEKFKIITKEEAALIHEIREARNKIHANNHEKEIVNRRMALDLSTAYDRLIKREW